MFLFGPSFSSAQEARAKIKELQLKITKLRQQKSECNTRMKEIRKEYKDSVRLYRERWKSGMMVRVHSDPPSKHREKAKSGRDARLYSEQKKKDKIDKEIARLQKEIKKIKEWIARNR